MSDTMEAMARARTGRDDRGRLCVFASVRASGGQRLRKRIVVPGDDESLAAETVRELNRRFALGDLSWFLEPTPRAPRRTAPRAPMVAQWCERWLEESRGEIGDHTWRTYRSEANDLARRFGDRRLDQITVSDLIALRRDLKRLGRSERTVRNRLAFLRLLIRDARLAGLVESSPFDVPLPRRRTKHDRQQRQTKRVTFRPLLAAELERVLEVLRSPRDATERMWFPLTDLLLLTGLRWGEGAGLLWPDVSERGALVHVQRTLARGGRVSPGTLQIWRWQDLFHSRRPARRRSGREARTPPVRGIEGSLVGDHRQPATIRGVGAWLRPRRFEVGRSPAARRPTRRCPAMESSRPNIVHRSISGVGQASPG